MKLPGSQYTHSHPFSWKERGEILQSIKNDPDTIYDLCVVGGGITGAGIARDAAQRGLKVLLLEKGDFAEGTSSRSSKLVHGGVRYLEHFEFALVAESTKERALLWKLAPHLAYPIPFLFPAYDNSRVPLWKLNIGLWLYDLLALFRTPSLHRKYSKSRTLKEELGLRSSGLTGSIFYWDGATDDALLTLSTAIDALHLGATPLTRTQVMKIDWNANVSQTPDQSHLIHFKDLMSNQSLSARAKVVVSAVGPWTDHFPSIKSFAFPKILATTRGSHIVVPQSRLPTTHAVVLIHPKDQRVLFSIPWGTHTILGTTDIFDDKIPDQVAINAEEVQYLLDAGNYFFPDCQLLPADVVSTWSGLRPLVAPPEGADEGSISREHYLDWREPGFMMIAGGKLTTHREMAKECVDSILENTNKWHQPLTNSPRPCRTHRRLLPTMAYPAEKVPPLSLQKAKLTREDLVGICRTQMVLSLEDLLVRRTQLFYKENDNGLGWAEQMKDTLCQELNWTPSQWAEQMEAYQRYLEVNIYQPLGRK